MASEYQYLWYVIDTKKDFKGRFIESGCDHFWDAHDRYKELRETFGDRFAVAGLGTLLIHGVADTRREEHWILGAIA